MYPYNGKPDLLGKLGAHLRGYASWLPDDYRVIVVVDRDTDDCQELKRCMEDIASASGLLTKQAAPPTSHWQVATRIAIEELEAWYFGDWDAVVVAYPGVASSVRAKVAYRHSDAIKSGTAEALERILQKAGHHRGGLRKVEAARAIGGKFDAGRCDSPSFRSFADALAP